ncbi:MAG: 2-C-methyl-D-erythritol 2,4-cyclodiphosphate synthase [Vulcanimicrobiaceae bacterium]
MRIGHGFDAHRLAAGRRFLLAGVEIEAQVGPLGYSDADLLAHAVADAVLGAAALGDLGEHFPSSDERFRDADSMELLRACVAMLHRAGYTVKNVDATVVLERPHLARYAARMRSALAESLGIPAGAVSVKAKSSDGLGYTGDGSGIAVYAVVSIEESRL